jgi:hypothetical protein
VKNLRQAAANSGAAAGDEDRVAVNFHDIWILLK